MSGTAPSSAAERRPRGRPRKAADALDEGNRRQDVVCAAARLFRAKGFAATTTRDIAAAAGMRSGSPFYHFESKVALLFAVVEQGMRAALERQQQALAAAAGRKADERLHALVRAHFDILLGPGSDFVPVMLYEWRSLDGAQRRAIASLQRQYEAAWADELAALHREGRVGADARLARLMLLGALNWSVQWYQPHRGANLDELAAAALGLFVREAAAPHKGSRGARM